MYPCTYTWKAPANVERGDILALQDAMFAHNGGADGLEDFPVSHHFAPNVYGREVFLPAGSTAVGKIHRHRHMNVVLQGRLKVVTEFGTSEAKAGDVIVSEPGVKRAVYAYEDSRWLTIHPNHDDTRDLAALEAYVIAPDYEALGFDPQKRIEVSQ